MKKLFLLILAVSFMGTVNAEAQLLWRVSGNGAAGNSYLFGTHHFAPTSIVDSIDGFEEALNEAEVVYGEIDMAENANPMSMQASLMKRGMAPKDSLLTMVLTPAQTDSLNEVLIKYSGGMLTVETLKALKPAVVGIQIAALQALNDFPEFAMQNSGPDGYVQQLAAAKGKKVAAFETVDRQFEILLGGSIAEQARELMKQVAEDEENSENSHKLSEAYMRGDLKEIERLMKNELEDRDSDSYQRLILNRNREWIEKICAEMPQHSILVAVGAGHLIGDDGLIAALQSMGYEVEPIHNK